MLLKLFDASTSIVDSTNHLVFLLFDLNLG